MKDEIKEIFRRMNDLIEHQFDKEYHTECDLFEDIQQLLDYITNLDEKYKKSCETYQQALDETMSEKMDLEKENEDLREDNYAYHQLMKMQNKREFRSKFLKEFQEEFGTNTFPDYDEIYKRYDKIKKENERLKKPDYYEKGLIGSIKERDEIIQDYKSRNEKAMEYIKEHQRKDGFLNLNEWQTRDLLNILGGDE